jgi:signal transduction histidine kinase
VNADQTRLVQVFDNLLTNAVKYAPNSTVNVTLSEQDDHAHIEFSDHGPGIPDEDLPNIFTRFYRVPNQNKAIRGTGLGLFICRRIINAHDGEITAESKLDEGTTFHIYLPIMNDNTGEAIELS